MDATLSPELLTLRSVVSGRYTVEQEIGRGGMGIVFRARELALDRLVAIKLLPPALAIHDELRERFLREARTAASLAHPHIVPIHSVESQDEAVFFVMAYVDGETLTTRVRRAGALSPPEVGRIIQQVARALGYAHDRGVIHRDVKPDNILIEHGTARTYVTDFGIARLSDGRALTREGIVLGTAQFMSPEQAAGERIDGRTDVYALGVVAYFALTGRLPFDGPTVQATLAMHLTQPPPPLSTNGEELPRVLVDVVNRCLAKEPSARFQTAEELVEALDALVVPAAEIAPLVRNWLRVAEQWLVVAWVLGINAALLAILQPHLTGLVALLAAASMFGLSFDLVARTRQLLREGFTHEDIRFASLLERHFRERELQSLLGDVAARARRQKVVANAIRVAVLGGAVTALLAAVKRFVPGVPAIVIRIGGFAAIGTFTISLALALTSSARVQRSNLLFYSAVWRRWFGKLIFRIAGIGLSRPRGVRDAITFAGLLADVSRTADVRDSETVAAASALFAQLAERAADLLVRERELDRSIAEVGAPVSPERQLSPHAERQPLAAGRVTAPVNELLARRAMGVEQLQVAREQVAQDRAKIQIAADNLRIQLLKIRARAGTIADLRDDLDAARDVLRECQNVQVDSAQ